MNPKSSHLFRLTFAFLVVVLSIGSLPRLGFCHDEYDVDRLNNKELLDDLDRNFTSSDDFDSIIEEYNKKEVRSLLEYGKFHDAKVSVNSSMNVKPVDDFKLFMMSMCPQPTKSQFGFVRDGVGWRKVQFHDPEVQGAVNHAISSLQNRVNCICKFKLVEILEAEAKNVNSFVNYYLLLKLGMEGMSDSKYEFNLRKSGKGFEVFNFDFI